MVDPEAVVVEAKDTKTGAVAFVLEARSRPSRAATRSSDATRRPAGPDGLEPRTRWRYGLGQVVDDDDELQGLYGLRGKSIREDGPTWVDALVTTLNDPFVSWLLLFVGLFMLVLELKLPGIGLPAITSALAFLLFFWSHYLSGTADQLEILLFLVGLICLALELFVFPGFGVFGMSGILLILVSIVMASHTFVWPTQEYEYREMGQTLLQVTVAMTAVAVGAVILARYFPSIPLFNRMVLKPEPWDGSRTATGSPSRPPRDMTRCSSCSARRGGPPPCSARREARFGELLVDVTADGFYIEPDSLVEVIDVQGSRVVVKQVGS